MPSVRATITRSIMHNLLRHWLCSGTIEDVRRHFASVAPRRLPGWLRHEAISLAGRPGEWLTPEGADPRRVVYYIHGGGFICCSPATHRMIAGGIARAAGARALQIDYRLSPEHPFPAPLDDVIAGYHWLLGQGTQPSEIVVAGDSAGGALTIGLLVSLRDRGEPLPRAAVCISPVIDATLSLPSFESRAHQEALLTPRFCRIATEAYLAHQDKRTPLASVRYADLHGLPPILLQVGTHELLYDDSVMLAELLRAASVDVTLKVWEGMWHVFHGSPVPEAQEANREIGEFIRAHFAQAPS